MSALRFTELLEQRSHGGRYLCVGLDPDIDKIPQHIRKESVRETIVEFNRAIIDATHDLVNSYKPNSAFYEAHGTEGFAALRETVEYIRFTDPGIPIILDAKRADIGNTNQGYIQSAFYYLGVDAITVHPYLGQEALQPFLDQTEKGIIILCRTSNPGAKEFQDLTVNDKPLYLHVARAVARSWNTNGNCGLVVGATYIEELKVVREIVGDLPILIPGIGAQNGDLEGAVRHGKNSSGNGIIMNAARAILYESSGADFAEAARRKAQEFDSAIRKAL